MSFDSRNVKGRKRTTRKRNWTCQSLLEHILRVIVEA